MVVFARAEDGGMNTAGVCPKAPAFCSLVEVATGITDVIEFRLFKEHSASPGKRFRNIHVPSPAPKGDFVRTSLCTGASHDCASPLC